MKKLFLAILAVFLMLVIPTAAFSARVTQSEIEDVTFNAVTTTAYSDVVDIQGYDKVGFFVKYDETEVGLSISAVITIEISYDGTNYVASNFYDFAGLLVAQTSETISTDSWYHMWLNSDIGSPYAEYVRVKVVATNTDADDLLDINIYMITKE